METKLGLARSGGGFSSSQFGIGAPARSADRGQLRRLAVAVVACHVLLACNPAAAQGRAGLPDYDRMSCAELEQERNFLRRNLARMQHPAGLTDERWTRTSNIYGLVNQVILEKCRRLTVQEQRLPAPPRVALMPEKRHVDTAMRAFKNRRYRAAQDWLLQGSLAGYASAKFNLGMILYLKGRTVEAQRWLRSAAQQGHPDAIKMLKSIQSKKN